MGRGGQGRPELAPPPGASPRLPRQGGAVVALQRSRCVRAAPRRQGVVTCLRFPAARACAPRRTGVRWLARRQNGGDRWVRRRLLPLTVAYDLDDGHFYVECPDHGRDMPCPYWLSDIDVRCSICWTSEGRRRRLFGPQLAGRGRWVEMALGWAHDSASPPPLPGSHRIVCTQVVCSVWGRYAGGGRRGNTLRACLETVGRRFYSRSRVLRQALTPALCNRQSRRS